MKIMRIKRIFTILVYVFAGIGFILVAGFFAMEGGLTNVGGIVDPNNRYFQEEREEKAPGEMLQVHDYCRFSAIGALSRPDAEKIAAAFRDSGSSPLFLRMVAAAELRVKDQDAYAQDVARCRAEHETDGPGDLSLEEFAASTDASLFPWASGEEWETFRTAVMKDRGAINRVSEETGVSARLILAQLVVEQLRLYHSEREVFKLVFQPLAVLGNQSKFSWGIMGIKESTAIEVENHLKDPDSVFYIGVPYEHLLDFTSEHAANERFERIINDDDHYYSYLYAALYLKQAAKQWERAGYDISDRPEIMSTLFNIGFANSHPKPDPQVGGAPIEIAGVQYSFGSLAYEFYYSGELIDSFPY